MAENANLSFRMTKREKKVRRLLAANELLRVIASHGRRFFHSGKPAGTEPLLNISQLRLDDRGRVWFHDSYTGREIYTHYRGRWRYFTQGGTMRALVDALVDHIVHGDPVPAGHFGPWPDHYCGGDLWGYGDCMTKVRDAAKAVCSP